MKTIEVNNIFSKIPKSFPKEIFNTIASSNKVKIQRIISRGHKTKDNYWYNQKQNEFVLLIEGSATLLFENNKRTNMKKGDYIIIPKRVKHRVENTSKKGNTIWLTVFYD